MTRVACLLLVWTLALAPLAADAASLRPEPAAADDAARDRDKLYDRLAKSRDPDEAAGIVGEIGRLRLQSGSDTADLLLSRALKARESDRWPLALKLFDAVVGLYPDWPEAWSERATARFQSGDVSGAMADIGQTLKRDPRDIGALAGLAALMLEAGDAEAAVKVYDRALKLAPAYAPLQEAQARAQTKLWSLSP